MKLDTRALATIGPLRRAMRFDGDPALTRRRAGAALFWRRLPGLAIGTLRPVIRPVWHWHLNLALAHYPQSAAGLNAVGPPAAIPLATAAAAPRNRSSGELQWRASWRDMPVAQGDTFSAIAGQGTMFASSAANPRDRSTTPSTVALSGKPGSFEVRGRQHIGHASVRPEVSANHRSVFVSPHLTWLRPPGLAATRSAGPLAVSRAILSPQLPEPALRRHPRADAARYASLLRTVLAWHPGTPNEHRPHRARELAALSLAFRSRDVVSASVPPAAHRRSAPELVWAKTAGQPQTAVDPTVPSRASVAPYIASAAASAAPPTPAHWPAQSATVALPDADRLVDEVIQRLDRRLRDERFRRGM